MTEKILTLSFSILIVFLFAMNFNDKWINRNYEKLKDKESIWFWFKLFNVLETKENFIKFKQGLSVFVISIMTLTILFILYKLWDMNALQLTVGFVQVRLEVVSIISSNIAAFVRAWPASPNIGSKHLSLSKARHLFGRTEF